MTHLKHFKTVSTAFKYDLHLQLNGPFLLKRTFKKYLKIPLQFCYRRFGMKNILIIVHKNCLSDSLV